LSCDTSVFNTQKKGYRDASSKAIIILGSEIMDKHLFAKGLAGFCAGAGVAGRVTQGNALKLKSLLLSYRKRRCEFLYPKNTQRTLLCALP